MFTSKYVTFQKEIALDAEGLSSSVNKPTSLLFSTSSMTARVHSQLIVQPSKLTAVKCPTVSPDTEHHCKLKPVSTIKYGWKRIEGGARIDKYYSCPAPCWLVLIT